MMVFSMGVFGVYKYVYSKYFQEREVVNVRNQFIEIVWVIKCYVFIDFRFMVFVFCYKFLVLKELFYVEQYWMFVIDLLLRIFDWGFGYNVFKFYFSMWCEEYLCLGKCCYLEDIQFVFSFRIGVLVVSCQLCMLILFLKDFLLLIVLWEGKFMNYNNVYCILNFIVRRIL